MSDKLGQALHFIISYAEKNGLELGAVKLTKTLVFSEVASLYLQGRSITGVKIVKAPQGPVPDGYKEALKRLEAEGKIKVTESDQFHEPTVYQSPCEPDLSGFSVSDLKIISDLTATCCNDYTAKALSRETHNHFWEMVGMGQEIPLSAYLWPEDFEGPPLSEAELAEIDQAAREAGLNV
jgi:hypothetical protein